MNITLKIKTASVGDIEVSGKVEKLGDVAKLLTNGAKRIKAISRVLPSANGAKVDGVSVGKE